MKNITRPGYEYLAAFMLGKVIHDLTAKFCDLYIDKKSRTHDQMVQAARSNCQNVAEGYSNPSLKAYIKLAGIAYGSNEELTKDYQDFLRQRNLPIWDKNDERIKRFREFWVVWVTQTSLNTPMLPSSPAEAANMLLTFCNLDGYLLKRLVASLMEKHEKEGGLTEKMYRRRIEYRKCH
ncbi:four helix bundle suffix domain-containing protein [Patescibacteria group bacterium]|nr:four helix bundle suffix domain-containing protein [Patescibacteria group bacterium]